MSDERKRILDMLSKGVLTTDEAEKLLDAFGVQEKTVSSPVDAILARDDMKFLYVKVDSEDGDKVDVRVPLSLVRAGMRLTSLIPPQAMDEVNSALKEHGMSFDLSNIKDSDIEESIAGLKDLEVNVTSKEGDNIKVFCGA